MKSSFFLILLTLGISALMPLAAQQQPATPDDSDSEEEADGEADAEVEEGRRGVLEINYYGDLFVVHFESLITMAKHEYVVDGGGVVKELTLDTSGTVLARFYFLSTVAEESSLSSVQTLNQRIEDVRGIVEDKTGVESNRVVKHYPDTTHARTVEFNLSKERHLDEIYRHIYREWIVRGGNSETSKLTFR